MLKDKLVTIIITLLVVAIAGLGYLFFDSAKEVFMSRFQQSRTTAPEPKETANIPAGTQMPLVEPKPDPIPNTGKTSNPQDNQISLGTIGTGTANTQGNAGNLPTEENKPQQQAPPQTISMDTANWKTYNNKKYSYSFKYPQEYDFSSCDKTTPCRFGQVFEKDGGDSSWLNGAVNNQGWPFIIINHYDNESYTLPKNTKFMDWLTQKMGWTKDNAPKDFNFTINSSRGDTKKAMKVAVPATPQAYARDEIYFEKDNKIFEIQLMDSTKEQAQQFYSTWLKTFVLN